MVAVAPDHHDPAVAADMSISGLGPGRAKRPILIPLSFGTRSRRCTRPSVACSCAGRERGGDLRGILRGPFSRSACTHRLPGDSPENMPPCIAGSSILLEALRRRGPRAGRRRRVGPRVSSAACSTRWRSTLRALLLMAFCPDRDLDPARVEAGCSVDLLLLVRSPHVIEVEDPPTTMRGCGTGPAAFRWSDPVFDRRP